MGESIKKEKMSEVLEMIQNDMRRDAKEIDGKPFDGKTVATYFGYQAAAISTLANILKTIVEEVSEKTREEKILVCPKCEGAGRVIPLGTAEEVGCGACNGTGNIVVPFLR